MRNFAVSKATRVWSARSRCWRTGGARFSGSSDRTLRLWDLETVACLAAFTGDAVIGCVAIARDDLFVAGSANGAIHILELRGPGTLSS